MEYESYLDAKEEKFPSNVIEKLKDLDFNNFSAEDIEFLDSNNEEILEKYAHNYIRMMAVLFASTFLVNLAFCVAVIVQNLEYYHRFICSFFMITIFISVIAGIILRDYVFIRTVNSELKDFKNKNA